MAILDLRIFSGFENSDKLIATISDAVMKNFEMNSNQCSSWNEWILSGSYQHTQTRNSSEHWIIYARAPHAINIDIIEGRAWVNPTFDRSAVR